MKIKEEHFRTLWYEDEDGNFVGEPDWKGDVAEKHEGMRKKAKYHVVRFPNELRTHYTRFNEDGTSTDVGSGGGTYDGRLVVEIVNSGDYDFNHAVILAAESCERCWNVLAHRYGLDYGYQEFSKEWKKSGTQCQFCEHLPWKRPRSLGRDFIIVIGTYMQYRMDVLDHLELDTPIARNSFKWVGDPRRLRGLHERVEDIWYLGSASRNPCNGSPELIRLQSEIDQARKDRQSRKLKQLESPVEPAT